MFLKILIVTYDENGNQLRERFVVDAFSINNPMLTNNAWTFITSNLFGDFYWRDDRLMFIDLDVDGIVPEGYKHITLEELWNLLI